tara:strand:- start:1655 stop:2350 length:696 start_codon:yes stop_codon:yes gene_type:complete
MSLINNVAAIIDAKVELKDLKYSKDFVYESGQGALNINWKSILPKPPANNSPSTSKELDIVSEATSKRSNKAVELVYKVDDDPLHLFFDFLETKNIKETRGEFDEYYNLVEPYTYALKYYFNRPRPEQIAPYLNKKVNVLYTSTHQTPAYPSGHTTYAALAAHLFSDKYPEHREEFFGLAKQAGIARILQGVHFPSDNKAGMIVAEYLFPKVKERLKNERQSKEFPNDRPS